MPCNSIFITIIYGKINETRLQSQCVHEFCVFKLELDL